MVMEMKGMCFAVRGGKLVLASPADYREMNADVRPGFLALVTSWRADERNLRIVSIPSGTRTTRIERDEMERAIERQSVLKRRA